jgi:ketosteroid isomerase-like protein
VSDPAENVAVVERAYGLWREQGLEGLGAVMHDEVEWYPPPQAPEPGPFRGPEEILRVAREYMESFGEFRPEPDRIVPAAQPDRVLVLATLTTVGRESGAEFTMPVGHLLTLRDGLVAEFRVFPDQDAALRAAGLADPG